MRTSSLQFQMLVDYMLRNGDLSKPGEGPHGKATNSRHWRELADSLNADATGDTKSVEKWRKVWSDLKNNTKKKSARIYRAAQGTGGGPPSTLQLSNLEQQVLSIMGTRAATGIVEVPEVGLEVGLEEEVADHGPPQNTDSPSILVFHEEVQQQSCFGDQQWNMPGMSAQISTLPNLLEVADSPDRTETLPSQGPEPAARVTPAPDAAAAAPAQRVPQRPTPLPPTPRRRRTRAAQNLVSPSHRRTRTQTQSDLARQAFVRSDIEWRNFQQEAERERTRLREAELRMQERWLDLFGQIVALGNRIVDIFDK